MKSRVVSATEFKAKCLAYLNEIEQRGAPITITRRGLPVAKAVARTVAIAERVGTARVHRLRLVTSDQRIIESGLVTVVA